MGAATYRLTIVKYGELVTRRAHVFLNHHLHDADDGPIGMDYFFWVAQRPGRTVVIDTGFTRATGEARGRTLLVEPATALAALGVDPAAAPPVVVTHAHYDHIGNLSLFDRSPVHIATSELDFWTGPLAHRPQFGHLVEDEEIAVLVAARDDGRLRPFSGEAEIAPGIRAIEVGGHTPGQSMVLVDTSAGTVLLSSDAAHLHEEYEHDLAFHVVADLPAMYRGFDRIRELTASGAVAHVVAGHDPATLERFTPVTDGVLAGLAATIGTTRPDDRP